MARNYYDILGVPKDASAEAIKSAYRKLSKEWHPDKHPSTHSTDAQGRPERSRGATGSGHAREEVEEKFKHINEAYEVLSNPKKKQMYDQFGEAGVKGGAGGAGFGGFEGFDFSGFTGGMGGERIDFSDLFEGFFGGGRRGQPRAERGSDREVALTVSFMEAVRGVQHTIRIRRLGKCGTCGGSGAQPGSGLKTCEECGGTGQVTKTSRSIFGMIQQSALCPKCKGSGKVPEKSCSQCKGEGRLAEDATVTINIPAGINDGQSLRVQGEGDTGRAGAPAGDLYVRISVSSDPRFVREGDDIKTEVTISVPDAILGTEIPVETVQGQTTLKIPVGTQSGQVFRMKGKGMPVLNSSRHGDHYVTVYVEIPSKLSREEKRLIEEWKNLKS